MNLKEHRSLQSLIALVIFGDIFWTIYAYTSGELWSLEFNLFVVIILLLVSNGLLLERRFRQLRDEIIQDKVEHGLQKGENLQESLDYEG